MGCKFDTQDKTAEVWVKNGYDIHIVRRYEQKQQIPYHPNISENCMKMLIKSFPNAKFTSEAFKKINQVILSLGCHPENTLFASSVCVDEINHHKDSLNRQLADFWGECFYMGGLGGLPFVGKTGFKAYSHHVPNDGHILILFAPHVGIAEDGIIGKYCRPG